MSALTDLFTSMANKIRTKTGGSDTYTPTEMVSAVDDVYDAGYADATTPITPSSDNPASMTSGTGYKPTANGYAISSYIEIAPDDVNPMLLGWSNIYKIRGTNGYAFKTQGSLITPSNSSPVSLTYGDHYRISGAGGYAIKNYTPITPSDASPVSMSSGNFVKLESAGYAIESNPASLTPSDSSPAAISSGGMYRAGGAGYAVASEPVSKTPSDTNPASVTSGSIVRPSASGYLYATNHSIGACGNPQDVTGNAQTLTINTGLPSIRRFFIFYIGNTGGTTNCFTTYNADISTTNYITYNSTNAYNKAIGTASGYAYAASVDSISGGTITLKTGANNAAAITNAWWVACS